jgi:hypothetical protein
MICLSDILFQETKKMMKDPGKKKAPTIYIHFSHKALASLIRIQTHDLVKVK